MLPQIEGASSKRRKLKQLHLSNCTLNLKNGANASQASGEVRKCSSGWALQVEPAFFGTLARRQVHIVERREGEGGEVGE